MIQPLIGVYCEVISSHEFELQTFLDITATIAHIHSETDKCPLLARASSRTNNPMQCQTHTHTHTPLYGLESSRGLPIFFYINGNARAYGEKIICHGHDSFINKIACIHQWPPMGRIKFSIVPVQMLCSVCRYSVREAHGGNSTHSTSAKDETQSHRRMRIHTSIP